MLVSFVAASAWPHGALRAELTAHRARPIFALDDDLLFSRRKMESVLAEARCEAFQQVEQQAEQKTSGSCASMPSLLKQSIVGYQLTWVLGSLLLVAEVSAHIVHTPPPVLSLLDPHLALDGVLAGIPGALLVSRFERWRSDAPSPSGRPHGTSPADRRQSLAAAAAASAVPPHANTYTPVPGGLRSVPHQMYGLRVPASCVLRVPEAQGSS